MACLRLALSLAEWQGYEPCLRATLHLSTLPFRSVCQLCASSLLPLTNLRNVVPSALMFRAVFSVLSLNGFGTIRRSFDYCDLTPDFRPTALSLIRCYLLCLFARCIEYVFPSVFVAQTLVLLRFRYRTYTISLRHIGCVVRYYQPPVKELTAIYV